MRLPGKPFKRLSSGSCNIRHRIQRRYRSLFSPLKPQITQITQIKNDQFMESFKMGVGIPFLSR
ncbi:MAG: hypothetical protein JETT_1594 [Candidatus Jettenia ecosi]|uniref:Uncharacterized protein n=1 Tax=Candidatus Jettenia ecosi TaxID=2494326 RepID=A0A533QBL7_9BACT|nr:MAG: hypothetical protein JETT_1594 [Candidatus Jettenia ecosi]